MAKTKTTKKIEDTTVDTNDTNDTNATTKETKTMTNEITEATTPETKAPYAKASYSAVEAAALTPEERYKAIIAAGFSQERAQSVLSDLISRGEIVLEGEEGAMEVMRITFKRVSIPEACDEETYKKINGNSTPVEIFTMEEFNALTTEELATAMTSDSTGKLMVSVEKSLSLMKKLMIEEIYVPTDEDLVRFTNNKIKVEGIEEKWNTGTSNGRPATEVSTAGFGKKKVVEAA